MNSTTSNPTSGPIPFPKSRRGEVAVATEADKAADCEHAAKIHELCRDTSMALQELRHGILNVLYDTMEKLNLNTMTLVQVLDERPSAVQELVDRDADGIRIEMIVEYLERLQTYYQQ
ncbi:hypothetical protein [Edaphobacter modestus]|uniref:Uncharacterized protein n=1 Tax=Edaphobacter modestus TaxID=388466 RepID=A0A4V2G4J1_9BACT|nr:hypothetical protein [Edaphobacter modestus]RZU41106.1 hypothetical protein BDD14_2602 [Edaphobacter modestus]